MQFTYPVNLKKYGDNEIVAIFIDMPDAITSGISIADVLANASDALDEAIAGRINRGEDIPEPSIDLETDYVSASLQIALKAALYIQLKKNGLNKIQFANKLGCDEKVVRRLLDPKHNTPIKKMEEALLAINFKPYVGGNIISVDPVTIGKRTL